jgi:hypothetical protein
MLISELGLTHHSMREHIRERMKFFKSRERTQRLHKLITPDDQERDMDTKMLAVLTRAEQASMFDILMQLFREMCSEGECDIKTPPKAWQDIEKFGLATFFWQEMARVFGYNADSPNLSDLLIRICWSPTWPTTCVVLCQSRCSIFSFRARRPVPMSRCLWPNGGGI